MNKSAHHLLYLIAKGIICYFEAVVVIATFIIAFNFMDYQNALYGVILGILIMPIAWKLFDWPNKRQKELETLKNIYDEERNNLY